MRGDQRDSSLPVTRIIIVAVYKSINAKRVQPYGYVFAMDKEQARSGLKEWRDYEFAYSALLLRRVDKSNFASFDKFILVCGIY